MRTFTIDKSVEPCDDLYEDVLGGGCDRGDGNGLCTAMGGPHFPGIAVGDVVAFKHPAISFDMRVVALDPTLTNGVFLKHPVQNVRLAGRV